MGKWLIRSLLSGDQYEALRQRFGSFIASVVRRLPEIVLLKIKAEVHLIKRLDYGRRDIFMHVESELENFRLLSCRRESKTVEWIETYIKRGDILYDIGANVGAYALVASKFFNGCVRVYAFEPAASNFLQLCKNIQLNKCQDAIVPLQVALSDKTTIDTFNYHSLVTGSAMHALGEPVNDLGARFEPVFRQLILGYTIDGLVEQFHIPVPSHMKIDVDGKELAVLRGADSTLSNSSVRSIIVELQPDESSNQISKFLCTKGFEIKDTFEVGNRGTRNCIFARPPGVETDEMAVR